mmetsp:Transcript_26492/g.71587  ORF Transcript_26492/g.71587 Transcript_26492/m.71587 type:complete len:251 (-) Transcript_26492:121-873(-)
MDFRGSRVPFLLSLALSQALAQGPGGGEAELIAALSHNYTNYDVLEGCFTVGHNLAQMTNAQGNFPYNQMQACTWVTRCKGFQIYLRPGDTTRSVYIEYKGSCTVIPLSACAPPNQGPHHPAMSGGKWYAFRSRVCCPPLVTFHPGSAARPLSDVQTDGDIQTNETEHIAEDQVLGHKESNTASETFLEPQPALPSTASDTSSPSSGDGEDALAYAGDRDSNFDGSSGAGGHSETRRNRRRLSYNVDERF